MYVGHWMTPQYIYYHYRQQLGSCLFKKGRDFNPNRVLGVYPRHLRESCIHTLCVSLDCDVYIPHMQLLLTRECFVIM